VGAGPIAVRGDILPPYVPAPVVTWPRICRRHGSLVPAAELLIQLARVEDEPGSLIIEGLEGHDALS